MDAKLLESRTSPSTGPLPQERGRIKRPCDAVKAPAFNDLFRVSLTERNGFYSVSMRYQCGINAESMQNQCGINAESPGLGRGLLFAWSRVAPLLRLPGARQLCWVTGYGLRVTGYRLEFWLLALRVVELGRHLLRRNNVGQNKLGHFPAHRVLQVAILQVIEVRI